jgi:hypothetical protein
MAGRNFSCKSQTLDSISTAIDGWDENGIQQGGVRYRAVSHCRTRTLLSSPIRFCVIVDENGLKVGYKLCEGDLDELARRRDAIIVLIKPQTRPRHRICMAWFRLFAHKRLP